MKNTQPELLITEKPGTAGFVVIDQDPKHAPIVLRRVYKYGANLFSVDTMQYENWTGTFGRIFRVAVVYFDREESASVNSMRAFDKLQDALDYIVEWEDRKKR